MEKETLSYFSNMCNRDYRTFAEAGKNWEYFSDVNHVRRLVGVGARINMLMIGMLGFDYGYGFDYYDSNTLSTYGAWKFHFVFGKSF